jgi:hypothetical protein
VCLVPHFPQKILGFGPPFCKMKLNTMQNFWQKGIHSPFWIFASRDPKKPKNQKSLTHPMKNLAFWMGTKHTHENFGILHFIIPK